MTLKRIISLKRGYDCLKFECITGSESCFPGSGGSHGVHGLSMRFVLKGPEGAVQFILYTGWLPQKVEADKLGMRFIGKWQSLSGPLPVDLGYHSRKPLYEGHSSMGPCAYCDGEECFYDGSGLNAADAMYSLVNGGDEGLWTFLTAYYQHVFHDAAYPAVIEYPKPLRIKAQS